MDTDLMNFEQEKMLAEVESAPVERDASSIVLSSNIMEVLFPAAMPPAPKNARMIRRFGFH
jgi:hypothetical protein